LTGPTESFKSPGERHVLHKEIEPQGIMTMNLLNRITIKSRLWGAAALTKTPDID
jgi:hypothetical protein